MVDPHGSQKYYIHLEAKVVAGNNIVKYPD